MIDENFDYFLEKFGKPQQAIDISEEAISNYKGKLPDKLLEYWKLVGFSCFKDGLFFITNPEDYKESLYDWLEDVEEMDGDVWYVIARSAFGKLYLWGENNWLKYTLDITNGRIFQNSTGSNDGSIDANTNIEYFFSMMKERNLNFYDENEKYLFDRALKKFGPLNHDEVFGFEPALIFGGEANISTVRKLDIHVHMAILKEFTKAYTIDLDGLGQILYGAPITPVIQRINELKENEAEKIESVESGKTCPKSGYWFTVAKENTRQYFNQGETFSKFELDWGDVYWQFDGDE